MRPVVKSHICPRMGGFHATTEKFVLVVVVPGSSSSSSASSSSTSFPQDSSSTSEEFTVNLGRCRNLSSVRETRLIHDPKPKRKTTKEQRETALVVSIRNHFSSLQIMKQAQSKVASRKFYSVYTPSKTEIVRSASEPNSPAFFAQHEFGESCEDVIIELGTLDASENPCSKIQCKGGKTDQMR